ncbi:MAG TPA: family 1 glycosylhydrolase [Candidatus Woesebacteria bacterium]|nr:family 1 glycosylhydrolase [Candidatus Woesebacteria bacterium]
MLDLTQFPKTFIFGLADADLQVIGEQNTLKEEQSEPTAWTDFAKNSGKVYQNHTPEEGIDRYHKWEEDIEHLKKMGIKHYRTSVSLSRILKQDGSVNEKAIAWYRTYFEALRNADIKVYVSLYHWEMPKFLQDKGGWLNRDTIEFLKKHTEIVVKELGSYIEEYFLFNEPRMDTFYSYYEGGHQPGLFDLKKALLAAHHTLVAQAEMFEVLKKLDPKAKVSTVVNLVYHYAATTNDNDRLAANYANAHHNHWFLDPLFKGTYPQEILDLIEKDMPEVKQEDMAKMKFGHKLYSLGFNYYSSEYVKYNENEDFKFEYVDVRGCLTNDLNWPVALPPAYPEGLYDCLTWLYNTYKNDGLRNIYITENGFCQYTPWDGTSEIVEDNRRIYYLREHLKLINKAIIAGVPITAYFEWTFMDNFEWGAGYKPESSFGLIYVDRSTMKRIWKRSAYWYADLIKSYKLV